MKSLDIRFQIMAWVRRLKTPEKAYQRQLEAEYPMMMKYGSIHVRVGAHEVVWC